MGDGTAHQSSAAEGAPSPAGGVGGRGLLVWGLLALVAYRTLIWLQPEQTLPEELEEWFFVPSQSISPAVVLMSLWLAYRRLPRLRALKTPPGSAAGGAALLGAAGAVYLWATTTGARDLLVPSLMLNALAGAWLWRGAGAVRVIWLPVAFLLFAMPLPAPLANHLVFRLQLWTADLAGWVLYLLDIPHLVAGDQILRTQQTFSVIESCSGLRSMQTLGIVSVLMMDLFHRRGLQAVLVVLAAPPVAFLMNGLRAVLLIVNPHSQIASIHALQGIAILLAGILLLFVWDGVLEKLLPHPGLRPPAPGPAARRPVRGRARAAAVAVALGLAGAASFWLPPRDGSVPWGGSIGPHLRAELGSSTELPVDRVFLGSVAFLEVFHERFERPGGPVLLFLAVGSRAQRTYSVLSPKTAVPGTGWIEEQAGWEALEPGADPVRVRVLRFGSHRYLVAHWYEGAEPLGVEVARALLALDRGGAGTRGDRILAVRIAVPIEASGDEGLRDARGRLEAFALPLRRAIGHLQNR
jgi:exosortase